MNNYFLIGSAPYVPEWWQANRDKLDGLISCMNNAIRVVQDSHHRWYVSKDFYLHWKDQWADMLSWVGPGKEEVCMVAYSLKSPEWYDCPHNGTMVLNAAYDILNRATLEKEPLRLHLVGCELNYSGDKTHFYEGGTKDPMRIPEATLRRHFDKIARDFHPMHQIVNAGMSEGLLPFERVSI